MSESVACFANIAYDIFQTQKTRTHQLRRKMEQH